MNDFERAVDVINKYFESISESGDPYEDSELLLFQNKQIEAKGDIHGALQHLDHHISKIVDIHSLRLQQARLSLLSGNFSDSIAMWTDLLKEQPENEIFHIGIQSSILQLGPQSSLQSFSLLQLPCIIYPLTTEEKNNLRSFYEGFPTKSRFITKMKLLLMADDVSFYQNLITFIEQSLLAGFPSLFNDADYLIRSHFRTLADQLRSFRNVIDYLDKSVQIASNPILQFWAMYLNGLIFNVIGDLPRAVKEFDKCINHTPTAIDAYLRKAEILCRMGQSSEAAELANECRLLDLQDRYLNNCSTKFFLRADNVAQAQETIAYFTKHDGDPEKTLIDLQCSWYIIECGESLARQKLWKGAIARFQQIFSSFVEQSNDLFDFHGYCIRKVGLHFPFLSLLKVSSRVLYEHIRTR